MTPLQSSTSEEALKSLGSCGGSVGCCSIRTIRIEVATVTSKKCPAQRKAFFCFVFFVATKKMKLLSGNPDGFAFVFKFLSTKKATDQSSVALSFIETPSASKKTTPASRAGVVNNLKGPTKLPGLYLICVKECLFTAPSSVAPPAGSSVPHQPPDRKPCRP